MKEPTIRKFQKLVREVGISATAKRAAKSATFRMLNRTKKVLPYNPIGDQTFALIDFLTWHDRWPKRELKLTDVLHRIKTSDELRDPLRVFVSDKEFFKLYVRATVGDKYNVPTIKILEDIDAVDSYDFPLNCCVKPTHASGRVVFRRGGETIDIETIKKWFSVSLYRTFREANYKYLTPKIIVEPLIFNSTNVDDYKIFCFNGHPKLVQVHLDRRADHRCLLYDTDWNVLPFSLGHPKAERVLDKPQNLPEMLSVATALSAQFGLIRVDLYSDGQQCLAGELTSCHAAANTRFFPPSCENEISAMIFS